VLKALGVSPVIVGRGDKSASSFEEKSGTVVSRGGIKKWLNTHDVGSNDKAIVAVGVEALFETASALIGGGIRSILLEKPGALKLSELEKLGALAGEAGAKVFIAYNRRFFASVRAARNIIKADGGVSSFSFEFTEWSHVIAPLVKGPGVKEKWLMANSTHVIDLAFFLGGRPSEIECHVAGGNDWHPAGTRFAGSGVSVEGALFTYSANWDAPGRWGVEILTNKRRIYLRPMERLEVMQLGTVKVIPEEVDYSSDEEFKPGLFLQTKAFLEENSTDLCGLDYQIEMVGATYYPIAGYHD
jgi:predicted dehydrogenase